MITNHSLTKPRAIPYQLQTHPRNHNKRYFSNSLTILIMHMLPADYVPGPFDVLCSRGIEAHKQNNVFRCTIQMNVSRYVAAKSTHDKNDLVDNIIKVFRQRSLMGGFIRRDPASGLYYTVVDSCARQKVSRAFREVMAQTRTKEPGHLRRSSSGCCNTILHYEMEQFEESSRFQEEDDDDVNFDAFVHLATWESKPPVGSRSCFDPSDFNMTRNARDLLDENDGNIDDISGKMLQYRAPC